ncbi:hydrogenase expression/formation protein HypD [Desulfosalsimonas propionicica]|uniref:Hydrogenase expression/formation protein HypD n=1 Tax=Desulfosalsimonas propionicica TaxID=332175 RepID=A0A7W0C6M7_9BACT|nr:hydrogenase formation protein HypD [Desulfosalsimonas propionicica]MBA2880170.1 hydrogenase expression/formation protein HypD [Desulfosalsimonas propionicica]
MEHTEQYRDGKLCASLAGQITSMCTEDMRIMEVCGTHTVSIFRHGIRTLLPRSLSLISGPGCPVCVTDQAELDAFIEIANMPDTILATFGDLMRVPATGSSLEKEKARGKDIRMVYSTMDALALARANPDRQVVFAGVGFETTAPTIAASILAAHAENLSNYSVYCAHKLVPPALEALMGLSGVEIHGFLLPGHVSVIIGGQAYASFFEKHRIPCVIAGFEPADMLMGIQELTEMISSNTPGLENAYGRAVSWQGNPRAQKVMDRVFKTANARWRGLGEIAKSGLSIREEFAAFDAARRFSIDPRPAAAPAGCACGEVLTGRCLPPDCRLYGTACTPADPLGPCMVSSEGTCAAYWKYNR